MPSWRRTIYCIFRYNAHRAPLPVQFVLYLFIGGFAALVNLFIFLGLFSSGLGLGYSAPIAFFTAAIVNYLLCILILFRHKVRWNAPTEMIVYLFVVCLVGMLDLAMTQLLFISGASPAVSKSVATLIGLILNFSGRRFFVFPEPHSGPWGPQERPSDRA